jgi:hypothetical protein
MVTEWPLQGIALCNTHGSKGLRQSIFSATDGISPRSQRDLPVSKKLLIFLCLLFHIPYAVACFLSSLCPSWLTSLRLCACHVTSVLTFRGSPGLEATALVFYKNKTEIKERAICKPHTRVKLGDALSAWRACVRSWQSRAFSVIVFICGFLLGLSTD